jgi:integrase
MNPRTIGELLDFTYSRTWRNTKNAASVRSIIRALKILRSQTLLSDLTPTFGVDLIEELAKQGKSAATINRYLSCLKRAFRDASDYRWILGPSPALQPLKEAPSRDRLVQPYELKALVQAASETNMVAACLIGFLSETGCRLGEALGLVIGDVSVVDQEATFRDTKNGTTRTIALTEVALGAISLAREWEGRCFPISRSAFRRAWVAAKKAADLVDVTLVPHTLRHTVATKLVREGVALPLVASFLGHKSIATTMRYTHLTAADQGPVLEALQS